MKEIDYTDKKLNKEIMKTFTDCFTKIDQKM